MSSFTDLLSETQQQHLEALQAELEQKHPDSRGGRLITILGEWLLDDEQHAVLGLNSWNLYFLCLAAHLFETDWISGKMIAGVESLDPDATQVVNRICAVAAEAAREIDGSEKMEYMGTPINIALLGTALRLAAALDIAHDGTAKDIAEGMSAEAAIPPEQFRESYDVLFTGPHAFFPGTIQVRIRCRHPEVHRALKHHESRVQNMLHQANGQVSPRFLFSELVYEIEPEGYTPWI